MPPRSDQSSERTKTFKTPKMPKAPFGIRIGQTIISELRGGRPTSTRCEGRFSLVPFARSARKRGEHSNPATPVTRALAGRVGAELSITGTAQKVSNLIRNMKIDARRAAGVHLAATPPVSCDRTRAAAPTGDRNVLRR